MKRTAVLGGAAVLVYVGVLAVTGLVGNHTVRPLFDAIGPPPAYRWVKPPPDFAAGNQRPKSNDNTFGLGADDLPPAASSEDSQFVFNFEKGAIGAHDTDRLLAHIDAVDPDTLGPLPPKQFADGNAYRLNLTYQPSGQPAVVAKPGSLLLTVPVPATAVVYSQDGKAWRTLTSRNASATAIGAELPGPGYYLAVSPDVISSASKGGGAGRLLLPIAITVVVAGGLVAVPLVRRRNRPQTRQARRRAERTGRG